MTILHELLRAPSAEVVWRLRGDLRQLGAPSASPIWSLLEQFHRYLRQLEGSTTSREYSHRASLMDIGAVGGVMLDNLLEARSAEELGQRLLSAVLSEGLMVLATRQHVKAWEQDLETVYAETAWQLHDQIWEWSERLRPDLPAAQRRVMVEQLLAPLRSTQYSGTVRAVLISRLYQVLIWSCLQSLGAVDPPKSR